MFHIILIIILLLVIIGLSLYIYTYCPIGSKGPAVEQHPPIIQQHPPIIQQPVIQQPPIIQQPIIQQPPIIQKPYIQPESVHTEMEMQEQIHIPKQEQTTPSPISEIKQKPIQESQPESIHTETVQEMDILQPEAIWVNEHNRVRSTVNQKPIKWNDGIAKGAQGHANKCQFQHSQPTDRTMGKVVLGENLGYASPYDSHDEKDMVKMWEDEKKNYKFPQFPDSSKDGVTGHYTQIINKNVTEIGCGCSKCDKAKLCVCRYNPIQLGNKPPY